jgi:hypothetical protein
MTSDPEDLAKGLGISKLSQLLVCSEDDPMNDQSPCNTFAGRGLSAIYSINDFQTDSGYLDANHIVDYVRGSDNWVSVGPVFDADNNLCAQALANKAYPVIAVMQAADHGHIALVLPGEVTQSTTWGFPAAFSASFMLGHPESAYVGGPLSKAFGVDNAKQAEFFYRKLF